MKWFFKDKQEIRSYDPELMKPVIRASICNGERVAGFKNRQTGQFSEVMLIRGDSDLAHFLKLYGMKEADVTTEY